MAKSRNADYDLIMYRLDTMDKRLDQIERTIQSKNDGSINTELLNIVLSMVRSQAPVVPNVPNKVVESSGVTTQSEGVVEPSPCGSSFMFNRRKTVV